MGQVDDNNTHCTIKLISNQTKLLIFSISLEFYDTFTTYVAMGCTVASCFVII
jgi:hypothetical protein